MAEDVTCPPVTRDDGRSSDDPCSLYCGPDDFDKWKATAQRKIRQAMSRQDLSDTLKAQLVSWDRSVETMPRGKWSNGDEVRVLATIAKNAECVALAKPNQVPNNLPDPSDKPILSRNVTIALIVVGVLGAGFFMMGGTKGIKKMFKGGR